MTTGGGGEWPTHVSTALHLDEFCLHVFGGEQQHVLIDDLAAVGGVSGGQAHRQDCRHDGARGVARIGGPGGGQCHL